MDKIIKVKFSEGQETQFDNSLKQWNFGQTLQVEGVAIPDGNVEVHYSLTENSGNASVFVGTVKNNVITVKIPNFLLTKENVYQSTYEAYAWIYLTNEESGQTMRKIVFTVESRAKPDDYIYTEEEKREYDELKEELEGLSQSQDELKKEVEGIGADQESLQEDVKNNTDKIDNLKKGVDELPIEKGTGTESLKIGNSNNKSTGTDSLTAGWNCQATAQRTVSLGSSTKATDNNAMAINCETEANGKHSFAGGYRSKANVDRSIALGEGVETNTIGEFVCGRYNEVPSYACLFIVGAGTSDSKRFNAHTIDRNGNAWYAGDVYVGSKNKKLGNYSGDTSEELLVTWNGDTNSRYKVGSYYKVSDETPFLNDVEIGDYYKFRRPSGISTHAYNNGFFITKQFDGAWCISMNGIFDVPSIVIVTSENATINSWVFAEKGIYFHYSVMEGASYVNEFYLSNATKLARIEDTLISDVVKNVLTYSAYMSESEKKAIRDALGITALIESLQTQSETE